MKINLALTTEWPDGTLYAHSVTIDSSNNLVSYFDALSGQQPGRAKYANAFPTAKKAKGTADFWNECYRKNGTLHDFKNG